MKNLLTHYESIARAIYAGKFEIKPDTLLILKKDGSLEKALHFSSEIDESLFIKKKIELQSRIFSDFGDETKEPFCRKIGSFYFAAFSLKEKDSIGYVDYVLYSLKNGGLFNSLLFDFLAIEYNSVFKTLSNSEAKTIIGSSQAKI